jgi:pimeloyl-ACP methyl ester carboxylesterase
VIFHGGPGLTPLYLREALTPLQEKYRLLWLDSYGWKETDLQPTIQSTLDFVLKRLAHCDTSVPMNFLGHSFGTHLVLELLKQSPQLRPQKIILSNPFPLTWERLTITTKSMAKQIIQLLSSSELHEWKKLENLFTPEANQRYLEICRTLYVADKRWVTNLNWGPYLRRQAMALMGDLTNFDHRPTMQILPPVTLVIRGEKDFFSVAASQELNVVAKKVETFPNVGHSPFLEVREKFLQAILEL